jgi:hypothetical protein
MLIAVVTEVRLATKSKGKKEAEKKKNKQRK